MTTSRFGRAFTLVEVVLALGVFAFVIVAILGLVVAALNGTKEADLTVRLSLVSGRVASEYRGSSSLGAFQPAYTSTQYFDYQGIPTNAAGAYFRVDVTNATPAGSSTNVALLRTVIRWPVPQLSSSNGGVISVGRWE